MSDDILCGEATLDAYGIHSLFCAGPEATRSHTEVKECLLNLASKVDLAAESEPVSLVASRPGLRPADVPTASTTQGTIAALDVGITAPSHADGDVHCTQRYKQRKHGKHAKVFDDLARQGVQYTPLIWSAWGRPHPDAQSAVSNLAARVARRRGLISGASSRSDTSARIGFAL